MNLIVLSIPIFFILMGVELIIDRMGNKQLYRLNDTMANISCGLLQQATGVLFKTILIGVYWWVYVHYRLYDVPNNWKTYILLFVGVDFFYYWFHRMAHEINLFWVTHVVHHQSEEYNFSVALRQSALQGFVSMFFYLPLAIVGFHPVTFISINALQTLYQFWIHTKTIGKMPAWVEFIFNTPSHHRVHHGRNPEYIDKNHGGTLIIFDRLFGTFQAEKEKVVYGVTVPLKTFDGLQANVEPFRQLGETVKKLDFVEALQYLFKKPGWQPKRLGGYAVPKLPQLLRKYDITLASRQKMIISFSYILLLIYGSFYLFKAEDCTMKVSVYHNLVIIYWVVLIGRQLDGKKLAKAWEWLLIGMVLVGFWMLVRLL